MATHVSKAHSKGRNLSVKVFPTPGQPQSNVGLFKESGRGMYFSMVGLLGRSTNQAGMTLSASNQGVISGVVPHSLLTMSRFGRIIGTTYAADASGDVYLYDLNDSGEYPYYFADPGTLDTWEVIVAGSTYTITKLVPIGGSSGGFMHFS